MPVRIISPVAGELVQTQSLTLSQSERSPVEDINRATVPVTVRSTASLKFELKLNGQLASPDL